MTLLALSLAAFPAAAGGDRITGKAFASRSDVLATHGMAATSQPLATQAALDVLKQGGTAIDAAIAANAMLGLVEPTGSGIGGDLFAIVWHAESGRLYGLNAGGRMSDGGTVYLESGFPYETARELVKRGHQGILYDAEQGVYWGASESRKDGQAAGY